MSASELSATLWRQRELLEMLQFKYEEQQLILAAGKSRWAPHAAREIEVVVGRLATANIETSVAISAVAHEWGLRENVLLRDLVNAAPDDVWKDILTGHIDAVVELIIDIREVRNAIDREPTGNSETQTEANDSNENWRTTYTARGKTDHTTQTARLIDASL